MKPSISLLLLLLSSILEATVIQYNGVPDDSSLEVAWKNGVLLNETLGALQSGDELVFLEGTTYYLVGGIIVNDISNVILHFDGTLIFTNNTESWPTTTGGQVLECLQFNNVKNITFTSSSVGLLDGQGEAWWGYLGYYEYLENRPRMLTMANCSDVLIENLFFKNSPYWTVWIYNVDGLEIRNSQIDNRRNDYDGHDFYNLGYGYSFIPI